MKKTLIYILLALITTLSMVGITANADNLIADDTTTKSTYERQLIPKPDLLPGPDKAAQEKEGGIENLLTDKILPNYAVGLVGFVGMLSVLMLLIAGVRFSMAYGNDEAIQKAKDQAIYALIGLVIAILSYTIVRIVTNVKYEDNSTEIESYIEYEINNIG
jgi:Type IV secretion system pilin